MAPTKSAIPLFTILAILFLFLPCAAIIYIWHQRTRGCRRVQQDRRDEDTDRFAAQTMSTNIELGNMRRPPPSAAVPARPERLARRARKLPLVFRGPDGKFVVPGKTAPQKRTTENGDVQKTTADNGGHVEPAMIKNDNGNVQLMRTDNKHVRNARTDECHARRPTIDNGQIQTRQADDCHVRTARINNDHVPRTKTDDDHLQMTKTGDCHTMPNDDTLALVKPTTTNERLSCQTEPSSIKGSAQNSMLPTQNATFADAKPFFLQPAPKRKAKKITATVCAVPEQKPSLEAAPRVKSQMVMPEVALAPPPPPDFDVGYDTEAQVPRGWI